MKVGGVNGGVNVEIYVSVQGNKNARAGVTIYDQVWNSEAKRKHLLLLDVRCISGFTQRSGN